MLHLSTLQIAAVLFFAACDRLWGSDVKIAGRSGHSLATIAVLLAAIGLYATHGPYLAALAVSWLIYRSIPFFGGSGAPKPSEYPACLMRHLIALILAAATFAIRDKTLPIAAAPFAVYALGATALGIINGVSKGMVNWLNESLRGALYGLTFAIVAMA